MERSNATRRLLGFALMAVSAVLPLQQPLAQDGLVYARDIERLLSLARAYGTADAGRAPDGTPLISGRMGATPYSIFFFGCDDAKQNCRSIQFNAGWTNVDLSLSAINNWNRTQRWIKAYQDEDGDTNIQLDINLFGGVSFANADDAFDWWRFGLNAFQDYAGRAERN